MIKQTKKAFTLVELIVVITILSILGTIAFLSFQGYSKSARDSVRISDLSNISKGLGIYLVKSGKLPIPENYVEITASGTILSYQGYAGQKILEQIKVFNGGKDPLDNYYYTLSVNKNLTKYQLLGYLENGEITSSIFNNLYAGFESRYPKFIGSELGIIIDSESKTPIQRSGIGVDITNTNIGYDLYIGDNNYVTNGTGFTLSSKLDYRINEKGSCFALLKNGYSNGDGIYKIYPDGISEGFDVYCDMINGGWTGLFSVNPNGATWAYNSSEWTNPTIKGNNFINEETTYKSYSSLRTNSIKICRKSTNFCYEINHNKYIPLMNFYTDNLSYIDFSVFKYRNDLAIDHSYNLGGPDNIGEDKKLIFFEKLGLNPYLGGRNKYGVGINLCNNNKLGFQGDDNNTWPSFDNVGYGIGLFATYPDGQPCSISTPIPNSYASSILITGGPCYYDNIDSEMWYVLGK